MSFLSDYLTYASRNEAPRMFHVWAGYFAIGACAGRRIWLPWGTKAFYGNPYVMFVGDAGNCKSVAMYNCKNLLARVSPPVQETGSKETPPGLWHFMVGDPDAKPPRPSPVLELVQDARCPPGMRLPTHPIFIRANEFTDFIGLDPEGWISAFCNISDEDTYTYRTRNNGTAKVDGPYICLLAGLTTDQSHDLVKQKLISTGLARRTWMQWGKRRFDEPCPKLILTPEMEAARDRCVQHLNKIRVMHGAFEWPADTDAFWDAWYRKHSSEVEKKPPQVKSWFTSKPDQVLRLAMLDALSEGPTLVITPENIQMAIKYLEILERDLWRIFGGVGRNELASVAQQVHDYVSNLTEPISQKSLKLKMINVLDSRRMNEEFQDVLTYLVEDGRLRRHKLQIGEFVDFVVATPEVLQAWAARHGVQADAPPVDAVQNELDSRAKNPLTVPSEAQTNGHVPEPPAVVLPKPETGVGPFPTLPKP